MSGDHKHVLDNETEEGEKKVKSVFFEWSPRNGRHLAGGQQQPATWIETTWTASAAKLYKMSNVIWSIILKSWDTEVLKIKIKIFIQTNFTLNLNKFVGFGKRGAEIEFVFLSKLGSLDVWTLSQWMLTKGGVVQPSFEGPTT